MSEELLSEDLPWRVQADGLTLRVKATPRASKSAVKGVVLLPDGAALALAIAAPPVDGAANAALIAALAKWLGVSKSSVTVDAGSNARIKRVAISGDGAELARRLAALAG